MLSRIFNCSTMTTYHVNSILVIKRNDAEDIELRIILVAFHLCFIICNRIPSSQSQIFYVVPNYPLLRMIATTSEEKLNTIFKQTDNWWCLDLNFIEKRLHQQKGTLWTFMATDVNYVSKLITFCTSYILLHSFSWLRVLEELSCSNSSVHDTQIYSRLVLIDSHQFFLMKNTWQLHW